MSHALGRRQALRPVHRLDRPTSGVLLCSPNPRTRAEVGAMFADGSVKKEYRALVHGNADRTGEVDRPLMDGRRGRKLPATTRWRRLRAYLRLTYLSVLPETGRKHQIRRHLRGVGHPLVGDDRYGPSRPPRVPGFPYRLWLHAIRLDLPDGRTFECPLPMELQKHLDLLDEIEGVAGDEEAEEEDDPEETIRCAACDHTLTTKDRARAVNGRHTHRFMNPHGYVFDIATFDAAPGCAHSGDWTDEFTWFEGHDWRYAHCGACHVHLGWQFRAGDDGFEALILPRLA